MSIRLPDYTPEPDLEKSPLAKMREANMMTRSRQRYQLIEKFADALVAECPNAKEKYKRLFELMRLV